MTYSISKVFQKIALATLTIIPLSLSLNLSPVRAASTPNSIGDITNLTGKIAGNSLIIDRVKKFADDDSESEANATREKSMEYVKAGYEAEQAENEELALANYYTAIKIDASNGYAFLMAGRMLKNIDCLKAALELFKSQGDRDGYKLAYKFLQAVS